jgi:hypothetical protein
MRKFLGTSLKEFEMEFLGKLLEDFQEFSMGGNHDTQAQVTVKTRVKLL